MEHNDQMMEFDTTIVKVIRPNEWWFESVKENDFKTLKKITFLEIGPNKTKIIEKWEIELISFKQDVNKNLNALKEFAENKS